MSIADTLSKLAFLVVLSIVVFSLLTHRMMQSHEHFNGHPSHETLLSKLGSRIEEKFHIRQRMREGRAYGSSQGATHETTHDPAHHAIIESILEKIKFGLNSSSPHHKHFKALLQDNSLREELQSLLKSHSDIDLSSIHPNSTNSATTIKANSNTHKTFLNLTPSHITSKEGNGKIVSPLTESAAKPLVDHHHRHKKPHGKGGDRVHEPILTDDWGYKYHPRVSPREGTNIGAEHQESVLRCINQSRCIIPELQLKPKLRVYFCKKPVKSGVRFYFLAHEGLKLHPNVELVEESHINSADAIIYLPGSAPWDKSECNKTSYASRLIVLDEFDGFTLFLPGDGDPKKMQANYGPSMMWYNMYFKRSYVARLDGKFRGFPHLDRPNFYPLLYSLADKYVPHNFNHQREIEILCTLRGHAAMATRLRVQQWVAEYGTNRSVVNMKTGEVNGASRTVISEDYIRIMANSRIIVTVNPMNWEGDFRLMEAFATGALVFVDYLFVPQSHPFKNKEHVIFYNNSDKSDLWTKLDYYRANREEAMNIGINGYLHAMKYHRTVNMIDYILRSFHAAMGANELKRVNEYTLQMRKPEDKDKALDLDPSTYRYTGQYLHAQTKQQLPEIKAKDMPGVY